MSEYGIAWVGVTLNKFNADLSVWSAFSLPAMPIWLGIQQKT